MENEFTQNYYEPPVTPPMPPQEDMIRSARKQFSRIGLMFFLGGIIINFVQTIASAAVEAINPNLMNSTAGSLLITMIPMYVIAIPLMGFLISRIPAQKIAPKKMSAGKWLIAFLICYGGMYASNMIGLFLTQMIGILKGSPVTNVMSEIVMDSNIPVNFFLMVICAPIAEELLFRRLLVDRMVKYGEATAVLFSGLMFALFHGNLNQFVYAFTLGVFFAFIYVKTGNIRYTIYLHMLINFLGSIPGVLLLNWLGEDFLNALNDPALLMPYVIEHLGGMLVYCLYAFAMVAIAICGIVLFFVNLKKIHFLPGEVTIPKGKRFSTTVLNVGMVLYFISWIAVIVLMLFA